MDSGTTAPPRLVGEGDRAKPISETAGDASIASRASFAAVGVTLGLAALLIAFVSHDPAAHVTFSNSPFTDEGFNLLNARNLILLGRWSTDAWNLHLVNVPFSVLMAGVFQAFGVGIVQARLAAIAMVAATVALLAIGLRRPFGGWPAVIGALAFGTSTLVLYYGRLAYLEDLVALGLVAGVLTLIPLDRHPLRWGLVGGSCLAIAIAAKPSAAFAAIGLLAAVAIVGGIRSRSERRWLAGATLAIAALGLGWVVAVWLPQRSVVAVDLQIWAPITWPRTLGQVYHQVTDYLRGLADDGAIAASLPLILLALLGTIATLARASHLTAVQRRTIAAAVGWFGLGIVVLLLASYRPDRYVVPLLPALAILGTAGLSFAAGALEGRLPARAIAVAGLIVAVLVSAPGIARYLSWQDATTASLPGMQARLASLVPRGGVVVGVDAPTLLMTAPVTTIVPRAGIQGNDGDLYTSAGARWFFAVPGGSPDVVTFPPGIWAARRQVACVPWGGRSVCLYQVP